MTPPNPSRSGPAWKQGGSTGRRFPVVPVAVVAVILLAIVALIASGMGEERETDTSGLQQTAPVEVTGDPLPALAEQDEAVGTVAPEAFGESFDGTPVEITQDGRPKVLVFLAHWCPHCQVEVPKIVDWIGENGEPEDVDIYGIATGTSEDRPNYPPSRWLDREGWELPTLADSSEGTVAQAFGLSGFPFFVALDADHQVVMRGSGELSTAQWEALLDATSG